MSLAMRSRSRSMACCCFNCCKFPLQLARHRKTHRSRSGAHEQHAHQTVKPQRLPEMWQHLEMDSRPGVVPDAVIVARNHLETIIARPQRPVMRRTLAVRFDPAFIQPFKPVAELHLVRRGKTQGRVMEIQLMLCRVEFEASRWMINPRRDFLFCLPPGFRCRTVFRPRKSPQSPPAAAGD